MTLRDIIKRNGGSEAISTEEAGAIAAAAIEIADGEQIKYAIAGGLAMHIYGFTRQTSDVDFIAARRLPLDVSRKLILGGEQYEFHLGEKVINVHWILRRDEYKKIYQSALADADTLPNGWKVVSPEWLVVLKYIAGRAKDELDLQYLLRQKELVQRCKIKKNLEKAVGVHTAAAYALGLRYYYERYGLLEPRNGDENESYSPDEN